MTETGLCEGCEKKQKREEETDPLCGRHSKRKKLGYHVAPSTTTTAPAAATVTTAPTATTTAPATATVTTAPAATTTSVPDGGNLDSTITQESTMLEYDGKPYSEQELAEKICTRPLTVIRKTMGLNTRVLVSDGGTTKAGTVTQAPSAAAGRPR